MKRAKIRIVDFQTEEYLPEPKRGLEYFSQEQKDLIDKLVEINVSRITAEVLIINYDQQLIEKWLKAIHYARAEDKAAYLVKAIRENWQVPEGYLSKEEDVREREEQEKIRIAREKQEEEENKRRREENERLEHIYNSLDPLQQEKIKQEAENRLPDFWKEQLNKERIKGETSRLARIALEEKKREVMRDWIKRRKDGGEQI
jgi:flagellar biosynthesis GTPase FlhF